MQQRTLQLTQFEVILGTLVRDLETCYIGEDATFGRGEADLKGVPDPFLIVLVDEVKESKGQFMGRSVISGGCGASLELRTDMSLSEQLELCRVEIVQPFAKAVIKRLKERFPHSQMYVFFSVQFVILLSFKLIFLLLKYYYHDNFII